MRDPYTVLGVARTATADEIRRAYRDLAKASHPDLHPGDAGAEARFKEASSAYDLLSDAGKRARFDRGEIDAAGNERHARFQQRRSSSSSRAGAAGRAGFGGGARPRAGNPFASDADLEGVFADLFGAASGARAGRRASSSAAASFTLEIDLPEAARGGRRSVQLPDGRRADVEIPAGVADGATLRLALGTAGEAVVAVRVRPHPVFRLRAGGGGDVEVELPVTLAEAVLGAKVAAPTLAGPVALTVPAGSNAGSTLRLRGRGMPGRDGRPAGDQYVRLRVVLPPTAAADAGLAEAVRRHEQAHPYDPRAELMREAAGAGPR